MRNEKYKLESSYVDPELCDILTLEETFDCIRKSESCLVVYSPAEGKSEVLFSGLDERLLATLVVLLSTNDAFHQFLKMGVIASDKIRKKGFTKGLEFYESAVSYIKLKFPHMLFKKLE